MKKAVSFCFCNRIVQLELRTVEKFSAMEAEQLTTEDAGNYYEAFT